MRFPSWLRKTGTIHPDRERVRPGRPRARRLRIDSLEDRIVPSFADITTPGVKDSLVADLTAIKTVLTNALNDPGFQSDAGARMPLLNRVNPDSSQPPPGPPRCRTSSAPT